MIGFLVFTLFVSSPDLQLQFLAHAQVAKNTTILPTEEVMLRTPQI